MQSTPNIKRMAERNRILITLDIEAYKKMVGQPNASDEMALCGLHKARYEIVVLPAELRHTSREWLESRGYSRIYGLSWPPVGELPE